MSLNFKKKTTIAWENAPRPPWFVPLRGRTEIYVLLLRIANGLFLDLRKKIFMVFCIILNGTVQATR